jgi:hypothetical protein
MNRTADRKVRQQNSAELHTILFEHLVGPSTPETLRDRLDDLEVSDKLTESEGLAIRAFLELLADQLDDATFLLESAALCAKSDPEKVLVLHAKALLAVSKGDDALALRAALDALWINADAHLWMFFLMIAHQTHRADVIDATLKVFAKSDFFDDGELKLALCCSDYLDGIRDYPAFQDVIAPHLTRTTNGSCN